ncbi:hypothetical protein [Parapedobacter luteus]|uniref:hypothetical protein n=1 Tax=Parapedobacter luteus TaxID=623280 RepID=UPI001FE2EB5A|nr:hypothetical protein [Parapedobacter luteus]
MRRKNWLLQRDAGIDLIPSGDFSFYDQVLDTSLMAHAEIIRSVFPSFVSIDGAGSRHGQQAYHANEAACR